MLAATAFPQKHCHVSRFWVPSTVKTVLAQPQHLQPQQACKSAAGAVKCLQDAKVRHAGIPSKCNSRLCMKPCAQEIYPWAEFPNAIAWSFDELKRPHMEKPHMITIGCHNTDCSRRAAAGQIHDEALTLARTADASIPCLTCPTQAAAHRI